MSYSGGTIHWTGGDRLPRPETLEIDADNQVGIEAVRRSVQSDVPVIFCGPVGSGKSTLMAEIDFQIATTTRVKYPVRAPWLAEPCWWTTARGYAEDVRRGWEIGKRWSDWSEDYSADGIASRVARLFLDDLGDELGGSANQRDLALDAVVSLLTFRAARSLPTWITTNLTLAEMQRTYGERIVSRLRSSSEVVLLAGADRRLQKSRSRKGVVTP